MPARSQRSAKPSVLGQRRRISDAALREILDADHATSGIVTSRGGMINRKHYARRLGFSAQPLGDKLAETFAEYERKHGIVTGPLRHLPKMREWLMEAYESRRIAIRDGKLDRVEFQKQFDLKGGTFLTRHPPIRALFDEFDARAEADDYLPADRQEELDRVLVALSREPTLNKDRLTINRAVLAETAKVPKIRFREKSFADALAVAEAAIAVRVRESRADPYVHGRVFPFSGLATHWSASFIERVGARFKQVALGWVAEAAKSPYLQLLSLFEWIGVSSNSHCRAVVADAAANSRITGVDDWEEALYAYRAHLVSEISAGARSDSSVDNSIKFLRTALDGLSTGQVVPVTSTPLPGVKYSRRRMGHLRTVAEATAPRGDNKVEDAYVSFACTRFEEACAAFSLDMGKGESGEFIASLSEELRSARKLPKDPADAVRRVLEHRLVSLRDRAIAIIENAAEKHGRGEDLLASACINGADFERAYVGSALGMHERAKLVRSLFPNPNDVSTEQADKGIANLLGLIDQCHSGIPPQGGSNKIGPYGQFFAKRYLAYGGLAKIESMLISNGDAVGAALVLYLCESGANVSVGRTLDRDCIDPSDQEGYCRITGFKARAKGKPIIVDLPKDSPAVRAIEWLLTAGRNLANAAAEDADRLFLMRIGERVQLMTPHWFTNWFKEFAASTPGLEGIRLVPNMIRPSVLLHAALSNDGRLMTGMAIGQHGLAVTQGYQQKWPTRLLYDANIRRFQSAFETLVMSNVKDAAAHLGITVEQFEARLGHLSPTGLGTFCKDSRGRPGEKKESCSTLDCWNDCPHLLIVAEIEAVATLQLWQESLRSAQPEWEMDRPERWDAVWLPWLCLTDVVEEKMSRGSFLKIWNSARIRAEELSTQADYVRPQPW